MSVTWNVCQCPGHAGCQHLPRRCAHLAVQTPWTSDHCQSCATRRERAVAAGLRTMRNRRPQDDLAVYERSKR